MTESQTKICQNCKRNFVIEPEDFDFYKKIKVPPPTFCPECRMRRRLMWRNQRHFFKKKDSRTGKEIFSLFPEDAPVKIYDRDFWWSDGWDAAEYGREYDWDKPFFEQLRELYSSVPLPSRSINDLVNSDYSMNAGYLKNCYMVFDANHCEDSSYLVDATYSKECFDCLAITKCERCYDSFNLDKCYRAISSENCESSHDIYFCRDCSGCSFCFGCTNLRNKTYCIFNKQYSKEEYFEKLKELKTDSRVKYRKIAKEARDLEYNYPKRYVKSRHNSGSSGEYVFYSKNVKNSYRIVGGENLKYCQLLQEGPVKDCMDYCVWGDNVELAYETAVCGIGLSNIKFCCQSFSNIRESQYCFFCHSSSNLFGCVGLRNKQYCILNKQYSKEEYEKLVLKIVNHMNDMPYTDKLGNIYKYGEFFPEDMSPFAYNDTINQEFFSLTSEKAKSMRYRWREYEKRNYDITIQPEAIPELSAYVDEKILKEIIGCAHKGECNEQCKMAFVITPQELSFYKSEKLPLPDICFNCRAWQRIYRRKLPALYTRQCDCSGKESVKSNYKNTSMHLHQDDKCPNIFETPYVPGGPEIVYCEACYNSEVA